MFDTIDAFNPELIVMNSGIFFSKERRDKSSSMLRKAEPRAGEWPPPQPAHTWAAAAGGSRGGDPITGSCVKDARCTAALQHRSSHCWPDYILLMTLGGA